MVAVVVPWRRRWDLASAIVGEAVARCVTTSFALRPERVLCIPNVSQPFSVVRRHVKVERRDVASQLTCSVTAIVHRSVSKAAHKIVGMIAYSFGGKRKKKTEKKIKKKQQRRSSLQAKYSYHRRSSQHAPESGSQWERLASWRARCSAASSELCSKGRC